MYQVACMCTYLVTQLAHNYKYTNNKVFQMLYLTRFLSGAGLTVLPLSTVVKLNLKRKSNV